MHHVGGFRVLPTLTLVVGQRADLTPQPTDRYDSLLTLSSPGIAFLGMDTVTYFSPVGPGPQEQVYHLRASAAGRTLVTVRFTDRTPAVADTIIVQSSESHGQFTETTVGFFLETCGKGAGNVGYCWGGHADADDSAGDHLRTVNTVPTPLAGATAFSAMSLGGEHGCGVTTNGAAYCWGANFNGQLGNGTTDSSTSPVAVSGGLKFQSVSAGVYHTCGLTTAGKIYCWGNDISGELGNDTMSYNNPQPVAISDSLTFVAVGAGYQYSCGLTTDSAAYCWGDNGSGALGNGTTTQSLVPVQVTGGLRFVALSTGYFHACGLTGGGTAYCWGGNFTGELGAGSATGLDACDGGGYSFSCSTVPVPVAGGLAFMQISAGQWATCGVTTGSHAYCWGYNGYGQLGSSATAFTSVPNPSPVQVSGGLSFTFVRTGYLHTCGITTQGAEYCWGDNSEGELGDGSTVLSPIPVPVLSP